MTATIAEPISLPGIYDIPAEQYHDDPVPSGSLSSSGARLLLPPSCPALFRHRQLNPPTASKVFDFGHAAHQLVLGAGPEIVVVEANDWRTKAAKEKRDEAHAAGKVPLLEDDWGQVIDMAQALRAHPVAAALFNPEFGAPEQTLVWRDEPTGVWRRAMLDWLPGLTPARRLVIPDYKTCLSASPTALAKAVANYGYECQAAWYLDGAIALGLDDEPAFVFVCQEKTAPYLVTVIELDPVALTLGRHRNRRALEIYRDCVAADQWPGYTTDIELVALPRWAERQYEESYLD